MKQNCEHVTQCRHYSNLLIAFVVCGVLLGTNVFMFTIIIFQNTIKLRVLKNTKKFYENRNNHQSQQQFNLSNQHSSNYIDKSEMGVGGDKSFLSMNRSERLLCCSLSTAKSAISDSCNDILAAICCSSFLLRKNQRHSSRNRIRKNRVQNFSSKSDLSRLNQSLSQSCTTITRPGYILQVPNATLSSASSASINPMSDVNKTACFARSTIYSKSNFLSNNLNRNRSLALFQQQQQQNIQNQNDKNLSQNFQHSTIISQGSRNCNQLDKSIITNSSCMDNYDNEIFYHMPKKQTAEGTISSAF